LFALRILPSCSLKEGSNSSDQVHSLSELLGVIPVKMIVD